MREKESEEVEHRRGRRFGAVKEPQLQVRTPIHTRWRWPIFLYRLLAIHLIANAVNQGEKEIGCQERAADRAGFEGRTQDTASEVVHTLRVRQQFRREPTDGEGPNRLSCGRLQQRGQPQPRDVLGIQFRLQAGDD
jgi:hypothetical protein